MCGPGAIAAVSLALTVASGVTQAYGQYQKGQAEKAEANYRAGISKNNAIAAGYLAKDAIARGEIAEQQQRLRGRLLIGQMRASLAGSGQVVDEGSAGDLVADQAGVNELDALNVRSNAEREAYGYRRKAANFTSEGKLLRVSGDNAARGGAFAAGGTLLSTGGSVASKWYKFKKAGAF